MLQLLQKLTNNKSNSLMDLFDSFVLQYPNEIKTISMLRDYIYNDNPTFSEEECLKALHTISEG